MSAGDNDQIKLNQIKWKLLFTEISGKTQIQNKREIKSFINDDLESFSDYDSDEEDFEKRSE